jgi:hypothetical protein
VPIAATVAIEMIGPIPSAVIRRTHAGSRSTKFVMSADKPSIRSSSRRLVTGQILDDGASCAARARQSVWQGCLAIRCAIRAAGCCGPKLMVKLRNRASPMAALRSAHGHVNSFASTSMVRVIGPA